MASTSRTSPAPSHGTEGEQSTSTPEGGAALPTRAAPDAGRAQVLSAAGNQAVQRAVADERAAEAAARAGGSPGSGSSGSSGSAAAVALPAGVHVDTSRRAGHLADALNARAVTIGDRISFAPGAYAPGTSAGRSLLAHELAHVAQQRATGRPVVRRSPREEVMRSTITPEWAAGLTTGELESTVGLLRAHLTEIGHEAPDYPALSGNLLVLQTEAYRRPLGQQAAPASGAGMLERPPGLPIGEGFTLVEAPGLPPEVVAAMPEGQVVDELPVPQTAGGSFGSFVGEYVVPPLQVGGGTSGAVLYTTAQHLRTYGFAAAGQNAIGVISFPQAGSPGHGLLQSRLSWGHTATYVRVDGQIAILRSHAPSSLLGTLATETFGGGVKTGRVGVPGSFYSDVYAPGRGIPMWTHTGARSFEVPVARGAALAAADALPDVGPSSLRYTGVPAAANLCQGMNCVRWAVPVAEEALGGRFGPVTASGAPTSVADLGRNLTPGGAVNQASQGRMYGWMGEAGRPGQQVIGWDSRTGAQVVATIVDDGRVVVNALPEQATGPPAVGEMSRGMRWLRWGGRVFFVAGLVAGGAEIAMADPNQRTRVTFEVAGGFGGGFLGGVAAGAAAGLVCGPGAPVCSTVLAIGGGIVGGLGGRALVSWLFPDYDRAAYRAGVGEYMSLLQSRTQGSFVIGEDGEMQWQAPDPRYAAYEGAIRRFESGESGGCQTCHDINYARQRTIDMYGSPTPEGDPFAAMGGPWWVEGAPRYDALSSEDMDRILRYIQSFD